MNGMIILLLLVLGLFGLSWACEYWLYEREKQY